MKKYSYLVLGTGVGKAIAYMLLTLEDTKFVTIGDINPGAVTECVDLLKQLTNKNCSGITFNAESKRSWDFSRYDVVVSALPARYNYELAQKAIKDKKHFCDLGGVVEVTRQMTRLAPQAFKAQVSVVPDCGLMPGLGMMYAYQLISTFDTTTSLIIYAGGLPQNPKPPLYYQRLFSLEGLKHICYDPVPILVNKDVLMFPAFSRYETFQIPELVNISDKLNGEVEAFATAGASLFPWTAKTLGVKNFVEKTVRLRGFRDYTQNIPEDQFETTIGPLIDIPTNNENPDLIWMKIAASGKVGSRKLSRSVTLLDTYDTSTGLTAMERTTGFTTALLAQAAAHGLCRKGVHTPECNMSDVYADRLLKKLEQHFQVSRT